MGCLATDDGATPSEWCVISDGVLYMARRVWINTLAEATVDSCGTLLIRGEGYVTRNDDGSISIN